MGKNQDPDPGSGMNNPDHISESLETIFWVKILKFFDGDPGSGMINIPDPPHTGSEYILLCILMVLKVFFSLCRLLAMQATSILARL